MQAHPVALELTAEAPSEGVAGDGPQERDGPPEPREGPRRVVRAAARVPGERPVLGWDEVDECLPGDDEGTGEIGAGHGAHGLRSPGRPDLRKTGW